VGQQEANKKGPLPRVDRLIWTAIGNTTNLAARLQQLTRDLDAAVIVDAATWTAAREDARDWVHHGDSVICGRSEPIDLYAVPLARAATGAAGLLP
jgi:class 3 adenylate cyclase